MKKNRKLLLYFARFLAIAFIIALSVLIFSIRHKAGEYSAYGYPGIFLISFLSYATVILPAPGIAFVFTMGAVFNPFLVALFAGVGAALGELSGYLAGYTGRFAIENTRVYKKINSWIEVNSFLTILALAAIPNPFFDLAGISAGLLKMPLRKFLLAVWIGVTIKMLLFAVIGSSSYAYLLSKL